MTLETISFAGNAIEVAFLQQQGGDPFTTTHERTVMHNKLVVADDTVVTGSFNLSNHAMGNAENVLLIRDQALAETYARYIQHLMASYATPAHSGRVA